MLENHDASKTLPCHPASWATLPEYCKKHIGPFGRKSTHRNRVRVSLYKSAWKKRCRCIFRRTLWKKCLLLAKACLLQCFSSESAWFVYWAGSTLQCTGARSALWEHKSWPHKFWLSLSSHLPFPYLSFSCASTLFLLYVLKCRKVETTHLKYKGGKKKKP